MRNVLIILALLICSSSIFAQTVTLYQKDENAKLTWSSPTTNEDGSALTDLTGFKILIYVADSNILTTRPFSTTTLGKINYFPIKNLVESGVIKNDVIYRVSIIAINSSFQVSVPASPIDIKIKILSPPNSPTGLKLE